MLWKQALNLIFLSWALVTHAFNQEAEAFWSLWVQGQPVLTASDRIDSKATQRKPVSKNKTKQNKKLNLSQYDGFIVYSYKRTYHTSFWTLICSPYGSLNVTPCMSSKGMELLWSSFLAVGMDFLKHVCHLGVGPYLCSRHERCPRPLPIASGQDV